MENEETVHSEESSLSFSCGSSPFDDMYGESTSGHESPGNAAAANYIIQPYQFEPDTSDSDSNHENTNEGGDERLQGLDWCTCSHCQIMPTIRECVCCSEIVKVTAVRDEIPNTQCITDHPGFYPVCLNVHVLRVAYYQYRQQHGERPEQNNERHRYTAYRQFVRWCWQYLGREVRVVLPSCVVSRIRTTFPDAEQNYKGFQSID